MTDSTTPLRDLGFMQALLDILIPPAEDGRMPGAGSLGLAADVAGAVETDAALGPVVLAGLQAVRDAAASRDPRGLAGLTQAAGIDVVESQLGAHPMLMFALARHVYPIYYQHPRVLEGLGEPPRPPFPEGYDVEPTDPGLLEALDRRGRQKY